MLAAPETVADATRVLLTPLARLDVADFCASRMLVPASTYPRAPPVLIDDAAASDDSRDAVSRYHGVLRQNHPGCAMRVLRDARLTGQGAVVTRSGALIAESVASFTAHNKVPDGLLPTHGTGYGLQPAQRRIVQPCLLAKRPWYRNYGHWLIDCAGGLAMAARTRSADDMAVVVGDYSRNEAMHHVVRDTLHALGLGADILVHPDDEVWSFATLCYVSPVHVPPLFKLPEALRTLRDAVLRVAPSASAHGRRLFLSRGDRAPRRLLNEAELLALCQPHGFELVCPERLSLANQAALFRDAEIVVGVKGAALTNVLFMSPGSAVITLSPGDFPDPFFWDIAAQIGLNYLEAFGPTVTQRPQGLNDFILPPGKLRAALLATGVPCP